MDRIEAGKRIRAAREAKGLTQTAAASLLGMSRQQYYQVESGRRIPAWTVLIEIVTGLGLDPRLIVPEFYES